MIEGYEESLRIPDTTLEWVLVFDVNYRCSPQAMDMIGRGHTRSSADIVSTHS